MKMSPILTLSILGLFLFSCSKSSDPQPDPGGPTGTQPVNTDGAYLQVKGRSLADANGNPVLVRLTDIRRERGFVEGLARGNANRREPREHAGLA